MSITAADIAETRRKLAVQRSINARRARRPFEWYEPSYPGKTLPDGRKLGEFANQLAFHRAPHPIRALFPGNGWGKTSAMGAECNAWGHHTAQWQATPPWPVLMLWFTKLEDQFDKIREQLQSEIFGTEVRWKPSDKEFVWPDGSRLSLGLADRATDWKKWQGIPVDLVVFDEEPARQLWREMMQRRRGKRKTRFIIGATATTGDTWMKEEIYDPWERIHADAGLDPTRALWEQLHPDTWLWWRGGIADNPGADEADRLWYEGRTWSSEKERRVRLHGGFESWTGDAVFEEGAIEAALAAAEEADRTRGPGGLYSFVAVFPAA